MIYFTGEVSGSSPGWPSCAKEKNRRLTPSCMLHLARGDIAQLVELRSCNWVVAITGWMSNCPGGNDSFLYLNRWLTFLSNGKEDRNMPLKDSTETKMGCQERRGGRMGSWSDLVGIVHGR
ncbi:hypothetical protein DS421_2g46550 [Arachis hypogaea]|nr:hypothetical protein DS421_2g46550 [Arachis hypogaea]